MLSTILTILIVFFSLLLIAFVGYICWDEHKKTVALAARIEKARDENLARQTAGMNAEQLTEQLFSAASDLNAARSFGQGFSGFSGFTGGGFTGASGISGDRGFTGASGISGGRGWDRSGTSEASGVSGFAPPQGSSFTPGNGTRLVHAARSSSWWCSTEESTY